MNWDSVIGFLESIGIVPSAIVPLIILTLIVLLCFSKKLGKCLTPIKQAIVEIQGILANSGKKIQYLLTETTASPLKPNDYGIQLFQESGLKEIFRDKKDIFLKELEKELGKKTLYTSYDVQEEALKLMTSYEDKEIMNPVKAYAYRQGVDVEMILRIGGLFLRDEFLKEEELKKEKK
ncbi:hypothetical protein LCGC14_0374720 [marine sediment metagenome]|uniref:Uncharacterized protein n=1 Tax=marine sediment metagenome TaxID=412755 RepID=A0A0F9TMC3_9ZZZZ